MLVESGVLVDRAFGNGRTLSFSIAPTLGNVIAIVVGRSIQGMLVDPRGRVLCTSGKIPFEEDVSPGFFLKAIDHIVAEVRKDGTVIAIGLAIGGYINPLQGISHTFYASNLWRDFEMTASIKKRFGIPAFIMNDANAAAQGENYYGTGKKFDNFLLVWLGEGTGLGIIIDGELYTGSSFSAGEIGHTHVEGAEELCYCGNVGCLETVTSEAGLLREYCKLNSTVSVQPPFLLSRGGYDTITIDALVDLANRGDRFAQRVFTRAADALVQKLSDLCNIFNPAALIFRGPVIDGNTFLFETVSHKLKTGVLPPVAEVLNLCGSERDSLPVSPIGKGLAAEALLRSIG